MPSGVSSFLLDCLDVDSPSSSKDTTLSSIEEFRRADSYGIICCYLLVLCQTHIL